MLHDTAIDLVNLQVDIDMARIILVALSVADHESQIDYDDEVTQRIVRAITEAFPDLEQPR